MSLTIAEYRSKHGLTLEQFGALVKRSKGHMSEVEKTNRCSVNLALEIERVSAGQIDATELSDQVAAARRQAA